MMRSTFSPAISPASLVAVRWLSSKYAGQVMTTSSTPSPRYASASCLIFCKMYADICWGVYSLPKARNLWSEPIFRLAA
jgi:hypothetical protein